MTYYEIVLYLYRNNIKYVEEDCKCQTKGDAERYVRPVKKKMEQI